MKITIIWGLRDAGKTSLIKKIFTAADAYINPDEKLLILQNEEGKESLQENLQGFGVENIIGGCICCTGSYFLQQSLQEIVRKNEYTHIIIEAAETVKLQSLQDILSDKIFSKCQLVTSIGLIDYRTFSFKMRLSGPFLESQILGSDTIIISKLQESNTPAGRHIKERIQEINPGCKVLAVPLEELTYDTLL